MIKISAIVCTFRRPDYLRHALRSLCDQTLDCAEYEIIVVDNACQSEAEEVVRQFRDGNIKLRYVRETEVGLSRARNRGLKEARGRYVAYMDDDARADEHWLEALVRAFERKTSTPAAVGGRVWLDWHGEKPAWVPDDQLSLFTYVDHGPVAHELSPGEYLVGANMAFDRDVLVSIGGFDKNLGRQGQLLLSGEEAHVMQQLADRGLEIYYESAAVVWHSVDAARKKPSWLLRRMFWDGASQPLLNQRANELSRGSIMRGALSDLRECGNWLLRAILASIRGRKVRAWQSLLGLSQRAGRVRTQIRMLVPSESMGTQR